MIDLEGRTLNQFVLRHLLGRGGMADVYLAEDHRTGREVALKVFKREDEEMLRRFIREARLMASLHHPHLMPIYDTGTAPVDGIVRYYIVMPYLEGGTLRSLIRRKPLSLQRISGYLRDIASALDYIHRQGIIHRDIKASNVLLSREGRCYLSDFGIARSLSDATQMTSTGDVLGTVDYVAPELFEPDHKADARSDFYSLGVLLYEMVTGRLPFVGENQLAVVTMHVSKRPPLPSTFVPDLPEAVERVMLKALSKDPESRYATAGALAQAFARAVHEPRAAIVEPDALTVAEYADAEERRRRKEPLILSSEPVRRGPPVRMAPLDEGTIGFRQPGSVAPPDAPIQPSRRTPSPARARGRIVAIIALVTLVVVLGPAIYVGLHYQTLLMPQPTATVPSEQQSPVVSASATLAPTATPNMTATAQALSLTATAQAQHATQVAIAGITATAQAQAQATVGVVQTATSQPSVYLDPLTSATAQNTTAAQWDSDTQTCVFRSDGYHVLTELLDLKGCREQALSFNDVTISVDMVLLSGSTGGVFFHLHTNFANQYSGYLFEVDSQGNYRLTRSDNYSAHVSVLQQGKVPVGWKAGYKAKNTLELIVKNNSISLYANQVYLSSVSDATYASGTFGFVATKSTDTLQGEAVYSNLKVFP